MRYDVKRQIYQVIQDNSLSKSEKVAKIKSIYMSSNGVQNSGSSSGANDSDTFSGSQDQVEQGEQQGQQSQQNQQNGQQNDKQNGQQDNKQGQQGDNQGKNIDEMSGQEAADSAQQSADKAQQSADKAKSSGDQQAASKSQQAADKAQQAANDAQDFANQGNDNQARQKAKEALDAANTAENEAKNANNKQSQQGNQKGQNVDNMSGQEAAANAQQSANSAQQSADKAKSSGDQSAADKAQQAANKAQQAANEAKDAADKGDDSQARQKAKEARDLAKEAENAAGQQGQNGKSNNQQTDKQDDSNSQQGNGSDDIDLDSIEITTNDDDSQGLSRPLTDYEMGYVIGKKYIEDMYKHKGIRPIIADILDIPSGLDTMKILESIENDIATVLDDKSISDDEKTSKIHDLFSTETESGNKHKDEQKEVYVPDDIIVMRNGGVDTENLFQGNHVIDKSVGDSIRNELGITPKDPDWGMSSNEDAMIKEAFPIIDDIFRKVPRSDKELTEIADQYVNKIKGRIRKSREGIIDWKKAMEEFVSEKSRTYKQGPLRKNIYHATGIGLKHRVRSYENFNKCVIYIDTSGSVNNQQTQLIPIMAGEVGKIMQDCHFNTVDIHLFAGSVYNEHFGVDAYQVADEDWGIEGASDGGSTSVAACYRHIIDNYMENGIIDSDVNAIVIITDVSGMESSGDIKPYAKKLGTETLERMLYVIYNDYSSKYLSEITKDMDSLISKYSQHYEITVDAFLKQLIGESMKSIKNHTINEALGSLSKIQQKKEENKRDASQRSQEEKEERLRKSEIQGARASGVLDKIAPELIQNVEKFFPGYRMVKEYTAVMSSENTYYVTDELQVIINGNFTNDNITQLCDACAVIDIPQVIGNLTLTNLRSFTGFPKNFPKEFGGDMRLYNLQNLRSFDNAPVAVGGNVSVNTCYPMTKFISPKKQKEYITNLKGSLSSLDEIENKPKRVFTMIKINRKIEDEVKDRIKLGESFISESLPKTLSKILPRRSRPQSGSKTTEEEYLKSTELYKKNRELFFTVIDPIIKADWGEMKDEDVTVKQNLKQIRRDAQDSKELKTIEKVVNDEEGVSGIRMFTDSNNIISAVYAKLGVNNKPKLVFLTNENGEPITGKTELDKECNDRLSVFQQTYKYLDSVGVKPVNVTTSYSLDDPSKSYKGTIETTTISILYFLIAKLLGFSGGRYNFNALSLVSPELTSDTSSELEIAENIFNKLFSRWKFKNNDHVTIDDYLTINFNQVKNQAILKNKFNVACISKRAIENIFEIFSNNYLIAMLIGASLRESDNKPVYKIEDILSASSNREELLEMIYNIKDVVTDKTALKMLSFKGTKADSSKYDATNPFDVMMMYPDKCNTEYLFHVDVNKSALERLQTSTWREISHAGMYKDIKDYEYDPKTGERTRKDILGTQSTEKKEFASELSGIIEYFINNKDAFDDIEKKIKKSWQEYYGTKTPKAYDGIFDSIEKISTVLLSAVQNNEVGSDQEEIIKKKYEDFISLSEEIEELFDSNDYNTVCYKAAVLVDAKDKLVNAFQVITNKDFVSTQVFKKTLDKRQKRRNIVSDDIAKETATTELKEYSDILVNISDKSVKVNDIVKKVDFSAASEDAIEYFRTKTELARRISKQLENTISIANGILQNKNVDYAKVTLGKLKDITDICDDVINASNDEYRIDFLEELDALCRGFNKSYIKASQGSTTAAQSATA